MWHKTKAAGVRPIRLHDARHSCGTAMHLRGVPLAVIAKWLGHADASITARICAHSQDDALKAAGQSLGAVDAHWCTLVDRCTLLRSVILDGSPMHPRCRLVTAFDAGRVRMSDRSVAGLGGYPGCGDRRQGYAPLSAVQ
jgi:hypothetical protein